MPARTDHEAGEVPLARLTIEERIAQLDARKKALEARLAKQNRASDTRRKVLLGAFLLHRLETGHDDVSKGLRDWLRRELPGFLTRDADKPLFVDLLKPSAVTEPAVQAGPEASA